LNKARKAMLHNWNVVKRRSAWEEENTIQDVSSAVFSDSSEIDSELGRSRSIPSLCKDSMQSRGRHHIYRRPYHEDKSHLITFDACEVLHCVDPIEHSPLQVGDCNEIENCEYFAADLWNQVRCAQKLSCLNMTTSISWSKEEPAEAAIHVICTLHTESDPITCTTDSVLHNPVQCFSELVQPCKLIRFSQVFTILIRSRSSKRIRQSRLSLHRVVGVKQAKCDKLRHSQLTKIMQGDGWQVEHSVSEMCSRVQYGIPCPDNGSGDDDTLALEVLSLDKQTVDGIPVCSTVFAMKKKRKSAETCCSLH
jgi:hypothetical protein